MKNIILKRIKELENKKENNTISENEILVLGRVKEMLNNKFKKKI